MFLKRLLPAAAVLALLAGPAAAQGAPTDVRCFILSNVFAQRATDPQARDAAKSAAFFFLGKIDGRWAPAALRAAIKQQGNSILPKNAGSEMKGCLNTVQASGRAIQAYSQAQPAAPAPAPPRK